jgi:hypothetical protein
VERENDFRNEIKDAVEKQLESKRKREEHAGLEATKVEAGMRTSHTT